jgi:hypothetical protein
MTPYVHFEPYITEPYQLSEISTVLPTNFKNFLLDQPKNSAAGEKVQPLLKIDSQRPILQFFHGS